MSFRGVQHYRGEITSARYQFGVMVRTGGTEAIAKKYEHDVSTLCDRIEELERKLECQKLNYEDEIRHMKEVD